MMEISAEAALEIGLDPEDFGKRIPIFFGEILIDTGIIFAVNPLAKRFSVILKTESGKEYRVSPEYVKSRRGNLK